MKVKCLLVDDEPLAIKLLENHISKIASFEVVATCNNAMKALEILNTQEIDLLFLDIKMPTMTGIDFLKSLRNPPKTIFTTAYREYALESYDLDVADYLLKPITFDRFFRAVERFYRDIKPTQVSVASASSPKTEEVLIQIKSGTKYHKVSVCDIVYIESLKDYVKIHTSSKSIVSKQKISDLEAELAKHAFLRIHRSYLINSKKVTAFTPHDIELNNVEVPIGASYKEYVLAILKE
ncbi:LytR/AlgR family response regulator transcription factor [Kordia sp.]|uniref:LytR/AlgR family response regulator transcription factor n=1 Tax=Kordia sp. TaxID=1965332 RepID=UPI003B5C50BC